ncbi:metal-dependent phosphoesterase : PHP domain protein OS=Rhodothermus marinus (strain ATCC 43812 / DSM 4252 / R-10) GN=Rmar_1931 PE=4 SV=1: PHP [Gemmata massiliana]|uniref:Polymerase/histidinol phosphatase N-terminal domain-containing protein n=1 Tax=Gemmata massiliana TaxID=1210884 RepID=A0A6P2D284_9BACT|nr:PHP domain-containing protein [Gemmata massiliana]VTR94676.1 metal-dependent phosphoesterase : PHP domain protein OS=Rhodothermus marinus (strain ATCC 43812 / DSM 4252 / R-10) GN=Rmar_1931 PE=4 SV=1: PHP [Gemmata massiliana]
MPKHSSFTLVCSRLAQLGAPARADLHIHTTASDGEYTASQVIALARQAGLRAVAVTDHDTLASVAEAQAAAGTAIDFVPGVEISTEFAGREFHLLGYFVRTDCPELNAALATVCESRRERFRELVALLCESGVKIQADRAGLLEESTASLGRRHAARLVVASGAAKTRTEAFHRFVNPLIRKTRPKTLVPLEDAIALVHMAGGVASLAHPPPHLTDEHFDTLQKCSLDALEVVYPWGRNSPVSRLREVAARFGFVVSGGSDCHGPDPVHRRIGSHAITFEELSVLRDRAGCAVR